VAAQEEREEDIPGSHHIIGKILVILYSVNRTFGKDEVKSQCFGLSTLTILDESRIHLAGPWPGKSVLLFINIEALLIDQEKDNIFAGMRGIRKQPKP
jgi:hypothetical protein